MQKLLLTVLGWTIGITAWSQCGERYVSRVFNSVQKFEDVVYSKDAPALLGASLTTETTYNKDLIMDIYAPPVTDTVSNRPAVIIAHGGGFVNVAFMGGTVLVGTMDNEDVQALADTLAHWGFVTASIEYRVGFNVLSGSSLKRAVWRGSQDMSAAVRFFRKNASWLGVDPNRVFVGGSSAGAFCCIHSTFVDYTERLPESYEITPILKKDLGALHGRPVVELTGTNPFVGNSVLGDDVDSIPQGIAAYWGAIADTSWLHQGNNKAPMIMFHGTNDIVVNYECSKPFSGVILVAPTTCGSRVMDSLMTAHNMPHELHTAQGEGHEYWGALNGDWTSSGPNAYWEDIISETADYFYELMRPAAPLINGPDSVAPQTNYTYTIANPQAGYTYCWEVNGGVIVSPTTNGASIEVQFYNGTTQGFVTARAIDAAQVASNKGLTASVVDASVSVERLAAAALDWSIAPNPASNYVVLELKSTTSRSASISLVNALGQEVKQLTTYLDSGANRINLSLENLEAGMYWVRLRTDNKQDVRSLILK